MDSGQGSEAQEGEGKGRDDHCRRSMGNGHIPDGLARYILCVDHKLLPLRFAQLPRHLPCPPPSPPQPVFGSIRTDGRREGGASAGGKADNRELESSEGTQTSARDGSLYTFVKVLLLVTLALQKLSLAHSPADVRDRHTSAGVNVLSVVMEFALCLGLGPHHCRNVHPVADACEQVKPVSVSPRLCCSRHCAVPSEAARKLVYHRFRFPPQAQVPRAKSSRRR